eukprot:TRINITY_DN5388_c0_g1_i1.p1 TRINITY_DN5388_c0_g1~~TRINITY_DN5388_c0_g1_i1.p1  ORF type:complete len:1092 (-),score=154.28 TRINITY_DN5388_c0_g1_i1:102-3377(-)
MNSNDLEIFESLVVKALTSQDNNERRQAQEALQKFTELDFWKQNLFILQQSKNPHAILYTSMNLTNILTRFVNSISPGDRLELRKTLLTVMAELGPQFWDNVPVRNALIGTFCRLQKLCWFDKDTSDIQASQTLVEDVMPFLKHSLAHSIIGIHLLQQMSEEISKRLPTISTPKQRKIAVIFRENSLQEIFKLGFSSMQVILGSQAKNDTEQRQQDILVQETLKLLLQVLSFDFIGTEPDESSDNIPIIHVPTTWQSIFDSRDSLQILFLCYEKFGPPHSTKCLEILSLLSRVRVSIFRTAELRTAWVSNLIDGIGAILTSQKDLDNVDNRHQMTRLLVSMKANYQLTHLLDCPNYSAFVHKVAEFSTSVFSDAQSFSSVYYVLHFWSRLVSAFKLIVRSETGPETHLSQLIPTLIKSFAESQISLSAHAHSEEPLASEHVSSILGEIPGLTRCEYVATSSILLNGLLSVFQNFQKVVNNNPVGPDVIVAEKQMAWMVYITSASLGARNRATGDKQEADQLDARALCCLFEGLTFHDGRLQRHGPSSASVHLELAFIYFLQMFCRTYISDAAFSSSTLIYELLSKQTNLKSPSEVVDFVLGQVIRLLRLWKDNSDIMEETLSSEGLFWCLATGFSSSKHMARSQLVTNVLENHTTIAVGEDKEIRRSFYKTLGRLLFGGAQMSNFHAFVMPWQKQLEQVKGAIMSGNKVEEGRQALSQILNDMRGFVVAIYSMERGYSAFFDWFYDETGLHEWLAQLMSQAANVGLEPEECWSIVHFVQQFSSNEHHRISFPITSANGIRLFRTSAQLLMYFGRYIMDKQGKGEDELDDLYKSLKLYLQCFCTIMSGGYTNFGVFDMYNDSTLNDLLNITCVLIFNLDLEQLDMYPKVHEAVYQALNLITTNHSAYLIQLEPQQFGQVLRILLRGLQAEAKNSLTLPCAAIDALFSRHIKNLVLASQNRRSVRIKELEPMAKHTASNQSLINALTIQLFNILLTMDQMHYTVSKPLLSLILMSQSDFSLIRNLMVKSQAHDESKANQLNQLFDVLMQDIQTNIESENRDKFTSNCSTFRAAVTAFIDLSALYKAIIAFNQE